MFAGSIVMAVTVLFFAAWLHYNDGRGWGQDERFRTELDLKYLDRRTRSRRRIHMIIAVCGILILVAAFAGPGPVWIASWMTVMVALAIVVVLAGFDALRTYRYQNAKLKSLMDDD